MTNPSVLPVNSHYQLPTAQRGELTRRIKDIFGKVPQHAISADNSKCILTEEKSAPVPDWWSKGN